jgi:hypothetical protein
MIKRLVAGIALATIAVSLLLLWKNNNMSDEQAATLFYQHNKDGLQELVRTAKSATLPERVEVDAVRVPCSDVSCVKQYESIRVMLRKMGSDLVIVNDQCNDRGRCSLSILVRRNGIYVSGTGTEIIYDTDPQWGYFTIHRLESASSGWYYRHLGD